MALISPGVQVSVIDESQYLSAPSNSVPLLFIATAENKATPSGDGVAVGTTAENANQVFLITSQRELVNTFGTPFFYRTTAGTPINGYELNEYGLLAAYSVLGVSNRAYVVRAPVDLNALTARLARPRGEPVDRAAWLDTAETRWGIFEWNAETNQFDNKNPIVITNESDLSGIGVPLSSVGSIGSYAVVVTNTSNPVYYKNQSNDWVLVGSDDWKSSHPVLRSGNQNPILTPGASITINGSAVTLTGSSVSDLVTDVNTAGIPGITAAYEDGRLVIYADGTASSDGSTLDGAVDIQSVIGSLLAELNVLAGVYHGPALQQSIHSVFPRWRATDTTPRPSGSVWNKLSEVNFGADFSVKRYDALTGLWNRQSVRIARSDEEVNRQLNPAGGGLTIPVGTIYAQYDVLGNTTVTFSLFERVRAGQTTIRGVWANAVFNSGDQFSITASSRSASTLDAPITVTIVGTTPADFVTALLSANIDNVTARVTDAGSVEVTHTQGGVIVLRDVTGNPVDVAGFNDDIVGVRESNGDIIISNWEQLVYDASPSQPGRKPLNGTHWYYSTVSEADIMIHDGGDWRGYRQVSNDVRGFNLTVTNETGPMISPVAPTTQDDGVALTYGDLWVDTSDLENYPVIYRWEDKEGVDQWVRIDTTDQTSQNGIVFADARWAPSGNVDPIDDTIPSIASLVVSDYLDLDAPDANLYPAGTLLFNTRRSGFNVKEYRQNYFTAANFPEASSLPLVADAWLSASRLREDGSPYMGRQAVRNIVISALKSACDTNTEIREEQRQFNLISTPGYPEMIPNMVTLNNERNQTSFVVGDTPMRLRDNGNDIVTLMTRGGPEDIVSGDPYTAVFYPSARATDLQGNPVVQPASHMMLRTIIRSDEVSYPWFAPAGIRRGVVDNATGIGYIDAQTGEFRQVANREAIRDVLYDNRINPITFMPGSGILNYGNKTLFGGLGGTSALDRINVARLTAWIRLRLEMIGRAYLFEPNDQLTRNEVKGDVERLMNELVANRGLLDYLVVCDESNNTPARIDRNELWIDVAIEPIKAIEFIYIPVRLKNTGEISGS